MGSPSYENSSLIVRGKALLTLPSDSLIFERIVSKSACSSRVELSWRDRLQIVAESEMASAGGEEHTNCQV